MSETVRFYSLFIPFLFRYFSLAHLPTQSIYRDNRNKEDLGFHDTGIAGNLKTPEAVTADVLEGRVCFFRPNLQISTLQS